MAWILLRNGTVLTHEGDNVVVLREHDILVEGNIIKAIGKDLAPRDHEGGVIDCTGKIISPGFIDTHHHLWQTQLKGRFGDQSFMEYMVSGHIQSFNYTADDIFWGQLGGCLESINGGVTTVVDHADMTYSPEHVHEAVRATASSGIRTFFCYTPIWRMKSWSLEVAYDETLLPDWWYDTLESLAKSAPFGNGRVYLGLGFDDFKQPQQVVVDLWEKCRSLGVQLKTTHYVAPTMPNSVNLLSGYGLLNKNILFSHINGITELDAQTLIKHGAFFSTTPDTELQMGLGEIVAFRPDVKCNASIGVDCHANNSGDLLTQLRIGFQHSRGTDNIKALQAGQYPTVQVKLEEVFNLGTIQGAKAVNMEDQIGSIAIGKLADLVIFDTTSPGMICAAEENPLAALLLHANVGDIEMVIVDGEIRKENRQLTDVKTLENLNGRTVGPITWGEVTKKLLKSRGYIQKRGQGQDPQAGMQFLFKTTF